MRIKIASVGEPVLRDAARPLLLEEIGSERIRELIAHMRETLADAPGVGLAAPQVG
jgi:peptide deformylase